jgi:hypothetical protein
VTSLLGGASWSVTGSRRWRWTGSAASTRKYTPRTRLWSRLPPASGSRLLVPAPKAALALPSRAVSDFWLALLYAEDAYRQFCQDAFGDFVPHRPPSNGPGEGVADAPGLARTLRLADRDEPEAPKALPWVFRVDHAVRVLNARRYLRDCGGGPECFPVAGRVCLRHLSGLETPLRHTYDPRRDKPAVPPSNA